MVNGEYPDIKAMYPGGQLLRDLLEREEYILLNNLPIVEGGPWTWVSRSDAKSCLDLVII